MEKIILYNLWNDIEDVNKEIYVQKMMATAFLFQDMTFLYAPNKDLVTTFKVYAKTLKNVQILAQDTSKYYNSKKGIITNKPLSISEKKSFNEIMKLGADGAIINHYITTDIKDNTTPARKMYTLLKNNKTIVYTIGESFETYKNNRSSRYILEKLDLDIGNLPREVAQNLIIVYYPLFAINSNATPSNEHIDDVVQVIRSFMNSRFGVQSPILYGGNVNYQNILSFCVSNNLDGFMIDEYSNNVSNIVDAARKVHGWQRIIVNQIKRRKSFY